MKNRPGKTAPQKADQYITIPVEEYIYLQKLDALMDVLLGDGDYSTFRALAAVRQSIREMKQHRKVGGQE